MVIVTLGPEIDESLLRRFKAKGVDFVRTNMSHSTLEHLQAAITAAKRVGIPFIIDTEGSQVRTGRLAADRVHFWENSNVELWATPVYGSQKAISIRPEAILNQLEEGDLLHIDFDSLILRVSDTSSVAHGYIKAKAVTSGFVGKNKAIVVDPVMARKLELPTLSPKDVQAIRIGLREGIEHVAVSFVRSGTDIDDVRRLTNDRMRVISKIECRDALENLDDIITKSDFLLVDRGDLSKEIPIERIPFIQKIVISRAEKENVGVFVATNLLESMVDRRTPTRAEAHDVVNTVIDGAAGLTLASETAIGKHPIECVNMIMRLIQHAEGINGWDGTPGHRRESVLDRLESSDYLLEESVSSALVPPHGGRLVSRAPALPPEREYLESLPRVLVTDDHHMELEQIALGTYSPIEGFMGEADFRSVLSSMRLADGTVWPIPIVLDVSHDAAKKLSLGRDAALATAGGKIVGVLHLEEKFRFDRQNAMRELYGTTDAAHPGVEMMSKMGPVLLGGKIDLIERRESSMREYELSPRQVRRLFDEKGWMTVLGFHTRHVIHRGHEFLQLESMDRESCDGLFVHPVVGTEELGDFSAEFIIKSYQTMMRKYYPRDRVVLAAWSTFARHAGPREALFTALCRKNYGCSHFIIGRDSGELGKYYEPGAAQEIFDQFDDLGIIPVKCDEAVYSRGSRRYYFSSENGSHDENDGLRLSGTEARAMFEQGNSPPTWYMRPEISKMIVEAIQRGERVFEAQR